MPFDTVFLDRDGVLNYERADYVTTVAQLRLIPGAGPAVARLNRAGLRAIVVTNQSGIARGYYGIAELAQIHDRLREELARDGARLDAIFYCPHHPDDQCACRKPRPGMLLQAAARFHLDLRRAVIVGDRMTDVAAGHRIGCESVWIGCGIPPGAAATPPEHIAADLSAAVDWILERCGS